MSLASLDDTLQNRINVSLDSDLSQSSGTNTDTDCRADIAPVNLELELEIVTDRDQFDALEADWTALYDRAGRPGNPFQSFNWCWHWANHFLCGRSRTSLFIVTGRIDGRLTMLWPMVKEHSSKLTKLSWLGTPVTQYGDVLVEDADSPASLKAAWDFICKNAQVDFIELYKVREDASIMPLFSQIRPVLTHKDTAPYADLSQDEPFADYAEKRFSKKRRKDMARYRRRFEEIGPLRLEVLTEGPEANALTKQLLDMKDEWLTAKSMVSRALDDPRTRRFFEDVAKDPEKAAGTRVTALFCGDELIAADLNFCAKKRCVAHVITYNLAHEKWSPGQLMSYMQLEYAKQHGLKSYDFMGPWAKFKMDWSDNTVELNDWAVPMTAKGTLWTKIYLGFARDHLKKLYLKLPSSMKKLSARTIASMIVAG